MHPKNNPNSSLRGVNEGSLSSVHTMNSRGSQSRNTFISVGPGFRLTEKIGAGNFGEIWAAKNVATEERVAVKIERLKNRSLQLYMEYKMYKRFGLNCHMPNVFYFFQSAKFHAIVMELMGPNLEMIFKLNDNHFSLKTSLLISMACIKIFEFIHSHGVLYRDVKPQNFVLDMLSVTSNNPNRRQRIYIIDFGLSKEYIHPLTKSHIPYAEKKSLTGTARYMSINTHRGREQSRRDDMESLGHMFFYFLLGKLPWQGLPVVEGEDQYKKIGKMKEITPLETLCVGVPEVWAHYLNYCRNLDFYERPDYNYLLQLFSTYYKEQSFADDNFDWLLSFDLKSPLTRLHTVTEAAPTNELQQKKMRPQSYGSHPKKSSPCSHLIGSDNNLSRERLALDGAPRHRKGLKSFFNRCWIWTMSCFCSCCFPVKRRNTDSLKHVHKQNVDFAVGSVDPL